MQPSFWRFSGAFLVTFFLSPWSIAKVTLFKVGEGDIPRTINMERLLLEKKLKKGTSSLVHLKWNQKKGNLPACFRWAKKAYEEYPRVGDWVTLVELDCRIRFVVSQKKSAPQLARVLRRVFKKWQRGGDKRVLKLFQDRWVEGKIVYLNWKIRHDRQGVWKVVDELFHKISWMSGEQRGVFYKRVGELSFVQQDLKAAHYFFERSLVESESREVRKKIQSIEVTLYGKRKKDQSAKGEENQDLEASEDELEIYRRVGTALKSGDILSGAEESVKLITRFSGGRRADWAADRIWDIYYGLPSREDKNYLLVRQRLLRTIEKVDGERLYQWAKKMYRYEKYQDAHEFAKKSFEKLEGTPRGTKVLMLAARAAHNRQEFEESVSLYKKVITQHSGTPQAVRATFFVGLVEYRLKNFSSAVAFLERLLVIPGGDRYELQGRYWLWQSLKQINEKRAAEQVVEIAKRFPFTYYGMLAQAELNGDGFAFTPEIMTHEPVEMRMWFTKTQRNTWRELVLLLKSGWFDEAGRVLEVLPAPHTPQEKLIFAKIYTLVGNYVKTIDLLNEVWRDEPQYRKVSLLKWAFPKPYLSSVSAQAKKYQISPRAIYSLIRQESRYESQAVSSAKAMGLMQLMPATAKQLAGDLKISGGEKSAFSPHKNIRMGTYYLNRLIRKFKGNFPLALAGYNAGPTRLKRWMKSYRGHLNIDATYHENLWMDELPWSETSFYVKAVLRNLLIYSLLDEGRVPMQSPVWQSLAR